MDYKILDKVEDKGDVKPIKGASGCLKCNQF